MSGVAVVVSGYLAGITLRGAVERDGVESQTRLEVACARGDVHVAHTLDLLEAPGTLDGLRDVDAGGSRALGAVRVIAEAHALATAPGDARGGAVFGAIRARGVEVGGGAVWLDGDVSGEAIARVDGPRVSRRVELAATALVTGDRADPHVAAGADAVIHAGRGVTLTLDALAGPRTRALLAHGQLVESTGGVQRGSLKATAAIDLGGGASAFAGVIVRASTTDAGDRYVTAALVAGAAFPF